MINRHLKSMLALVAVLSVALVGCSKDEASNPVSGGNTAPKLDIVETAAAAGNFTTLLAAAEAAGLVDALKGEGPLTVFAPTDAAFAALPAGTVDALLKDPDALTAILTYHVVPGAVRSADVVKLSTAPTLNGAELNITVTSEGKVMVENANVVVVDIEASNGIIHVIDAVMLPPSAVSARLGADGPANSLGSSYSVGGSWISQAIRDGEFKWLTSRLSLYTVAKLAGLPTLTKAVRAADLQGTLMFGGPFTLFGPTEEAFAALPPGTIDALLKDPATLSNILLYHVIPGVVKAADVVNLTEATMANGEKVTITVGDGVKINDANVIVVDIPARNGVLHIIDGVLIP
jgi:transforming growth factor-beta-induced protein